MYNCFPKTHLKVSFWPFGTNDYKVILIDGFYWQTKDKVRALNLVGNYWDLIRIVDEDLEKLPNLKFLEVREGILLETATIISRS